MAEIILKTGHKVLIDDEDLEKVSGYGWSIHKPNAGNLEYARTDIRINGKRKLLYLHRFIMNAPKGTKIDHKNHNGLDNRKENLRLATSAQNTRNSLRRRDSKTGFKGVYRQDNRYIAHITVNYKQRKLGSFTSAEDAAKAYDQSARTEHGEFALLNFTET